MGLVAFVSMSLAPFAIPDYFLHARRSAFAWDPCVLWVRVNAVVDASAAVPVAGGRITGSKRGADPCCTSVVIGAGAGAARWLDGLTRELRSFFYNK